MVIEENMGVKLGNCDNSNNNKTCSSNSNSNKLNGYFHGSSSCSGSGDGSSLQTYKRRKFNAKLIDLEKLPSLPRSNDKTVKEVVDISSQNNSCEQVRNPKINGHSGMNGSNNCSYQHWRSVLESINRSLCPSQGVGGGLQDSIRDALLSNPGSSHANTSKEADGYHCNGTHFVRIGTNNGYQDPIKGFSAVNSNGASSDLGHSNVSTLCEHIFYKLVMSGKFASLCNLLSENFHGLKVEKFLDFRLINSRIRDGSYEHEPKLFQSDIQKIWSRLILVGNEMVSLSSNLLELSRAFCHELGGDAENGFGRDKKHELTTREPDIHIKQEEPDTSMFCTCRECGERSDGRDSLVCDSCELMFHVSCIKPTLTEIPHKSWYCANCTANGINSPHEDCVVCERLILNSGNGIDPLPISVEPLDDDDDHDDDDDNDDDSSDGINGTGVQIYMGSKRSRTCKICGCILNNGDEFRVCEHPFCSYKVYHTRCLTNKEVKTYGPRWYCPSCLCRVCLTDKDDDDLCLCDGCDHGYHTYCMNPPRNSIPKGKWFCPKCDVGIKAIRKVKKIYEDLERKQMKVDGKQVSGNSSKSKIEFEDVVNGSGGMDMLLTAARTLNDEEFDVQHGKC